MRKHVVLSDKPLRLECRFDSCPGRVWVVFGYDDRHLVTDIDTEIRDTREQDTVFAALDLDVVGAVVLHERADDLLARGRVDLLVDEATVVGDGQLQDVTFDEL